MIKILPKYETKGRLKPIELMGFKSKLEYITSKWLEKLGIKAIYEPSTYKTKIGNYTPDFYCPEINTFIECKPSIDFAALDLYKQFIIEKKADFLIIIPEGIYCLEWYGNEDYSNEMTPLGGNYVITDYTNSYIILCRHCEKISFCNNLGSYHCRACKKHEGDHDLKDTESEDYSFILFYNSFYVSRRNQ